jgi:hypothetical protein
MNIVTLDQIIAWRPCDAYTDNDNALLLRLANGATECPLIDIMRRSDIPFTDRVWIATQKNVLTDAQRVAAMEAVVTRAVRNHALGTVIDAWARRWLSGEDRSAEAAEAAEESVLWEAAGFAARAAALSAALSAGRIATAAWAARALAAAAAEAAAAKAAWAALAVAARALAAAQAEAAAADATEVAKAAAWVAEREQQVADLIAVLENKRTSTPDAPETLL